MSVTKIAPFNMMDELKTLPTTEYQLFERAFEKFKESKRLGHDMLSLVVVSEKVRDPSDSLENLRDGTRHLQGYFSADAYVVMPSTVMKIS